MRYQSNIVSFYVVLFLCTTIAYCQDPALVAHAAATSSNTGPAVTSAINTTGANTLLACYGASTAGNLSTNTYTVTGATWSAGIVTLTIGSNNLVTGQNVSVTGITPSGFNINPVTLTSSGSTIKYAVTSNPGTYTGGGSVVGLVISDTIGGSPSGNTWTQIKRLPFASDTQGQMWAAFAANVGANHIFTAQGYAPAVAVGAFSGISSGPDLAAATPPAVISAEGFTSSGTLGSLTPTYNDELIWNCMTGHVGSGGVLSANSPLTTLDQVPSTGINIWGIMSAYEIQAVSTSTSVVDTYSGTLNYTIALATPFFSVANPSPLIIPAFTLPEAFVGATYSYQLEATGGNYPYSWSQTAGTSLSTYGLSLSAGGLISGTPTSTASAVSITFTVMDASSPSPLTASTTGITLTIATSPLSISTTSCPSGVQYMSYAGCTISFSGGTAPLSVAYVDNNTYNINALPEGLSLNASTGAITSSQIGAQGIYQVQFIVTDNLGSTATSSVINFSMQGNNAWIAPNCPSSPTVFPCNNIIYSRVDAASTGLPVDTSPAAPLYSGYSGNHLTMGFGQYVADGGFGAIEVPDSQALVSVVTTAFQYYFGTGINGAPPVGTPAPTAPIPLNAPIEGTANCPSCDQHVLVWKEPGNGHDAKLQEMYESAVSAGAWSDQSNALFDSTSNAILTQGTTAASHTPILPMLYNADEILGTGTPTAPNGVITHAGILVGPNNGEHLLPYYTWFAGGCDGCTTNTTFIGNCYNGATLIPRGSYLSQSSPPSSCGWSGIYGERYRISASATPPSCLSTSPQATIIYTAWKNYGLVLTDLGSFWSVEGLSDPRLNDVDLQCLNNVQLGAFEPVNVSSLIVSQTSMATSGGGGTAPTFTSSCPTSTATQGVTYGPFTATASGTTPISFSVYSGALPTGLSISGSGVISGTPTGSGTNTFYLEASNSAGIATQGSCSITTTPVSPVVGTGISAMGTVRQ